MICNLFESEWSFVFISSKDQFQQSYNPDFLLEMGDFLSNLGVFLQLRSEFSQSLNEFFDLAVSQELQQMEQPLEIRAFETVEYVFIELKHENGLTSSAIL